MGPTRSHQGANCSTNAIWFYAAAVARFDARARTSKAVTWLRCARAPLPLGLCGALVTFLSLAGMLIVVHPAFLSADESHHLDHAWRIGHGELPELDDGIDGRSGLPASPYQWTSQHPPLFYLLLAPMVRPLLDQQRWLAATMTGRLVVVTIGALVVLAVAWATTRIVREPDPTLVVGATMVAAVISPFVAHSAAVYNDALAILAATVAVGLVADMLRRGPTTGRLAALVGTCTVGFATRAAFLVVMVVVALGTAIVSTRAGTGRRVTARLISAGAGATVILAVPVIVSGWFYARNRRLTGHWTGADPDLGEVFGRMQRSIPDVAVDFAVWRRGIGGLLTNPASAVDQAWTVEVLPLLVVAVVAGLGALRAVRWVATARIEPSDLLVGALVVLLFAGIAAQYVVHVADGGGANPRYLLLALLPISLGAAYGLRATRRTRGLLLVGFSILGAALILEQSVRVLELRRFGTAVSVSEAWKRGAALNQVPRFVIPVLLGSLMVGMVLQATALWRLTQPAELSATDAAVTPADDPKTSRGFETGEAGESTGSMPRTPIH